MESKTPSKEQIVINLRVRNLMRLFLQSIQDYEREGGDRICNDEREPLEFVDIFLESEDAFDYAALMTIQSALIAEHKLMGEALQKIEAEGSGYSKETAWKTLKNITL